jgi:hypothetical protein
MTNSFEILKKLTPVALFFLIIHVLLFKLPFLQEKETEFYYNIPILYLLFFVFSFLILIIVTKISEKNFDNTGMIFMVATSIKMVVAFFLVRPILYREDNKIEKINFFAVFILFLLLETIIAAKFLNKK